VRNKKIAVIVISALLVILSGCNNTGADTENNNAASGGRREIGFAIIADEVENITDEMVLIIGDEEKMRDEFSRLERNASTARNDIYVQRDFYSLDSLKIEGYKLHHARIGSSGVAYVYVPKTPEPDEIDLAGNQILCQSTLIDIRVMSPGSPDSFEDIVKANVNRSDADYELTQDGVLYSAGGAYVPMGASFVSVFAEGRDYDFLRDLALQVIDSAELVNVQHESDLLRQG
jgi:hypothetical protein